MTQSAIVTKIIDEATAEVTVTRKSACSGACPSCGDACSAKNRLTVTAVNSVRASVGERVTIAGKSAGVLRAAALVYILPLVFIIAGYGIAAAVSLSERLCVAFSLIAFVLGVAFVVLINRVFKPYRSIGFVIVDIL